MKNIGKKRLKNGKKIEFRNEESVPQTRKAKTIRKLLDNTVGNVS